MVKCQILDLTVNIKGNALYIRQHFIACQEAVRWFRVEMQNDISRKNVSIFGEREKKGENYRVVERFTAIHHGTRLFSSGSEKVGQIDSSQETNRKTDK